LEAQERHEIMAIEIMPQVGQGIETATVVEWHKKENDTVNKGDVITAFEPDQATFDVNDSDVLLKRLYGKGPGGWLRKEG